MRASLIVWRHDNDSEPKARGFGKSETPLRSVRRCRGCRPRDGVLEQVETEERRAGVLAEVELVDVDGVHRDVVAVRTVARRRRGADVATHAGVVDQRERPAG